MRAEKCIRFKIKKKSENPNRKRKLFKERKIGIYYLKR